MKNDMFTTILNVVLAVSTLLSVVFCLQFISLTRQARSISGQVTGINNYRATMQALLNDCTAYGEKNPAIKPIIESVLPKTAAPARQPVAK